MWRNILALIIFLLPSCLSIFILRLLKYKMPTLQDRFFMDKYRGIGNERSCPDRTFQYDSG